MKRGSTLFLRGAILFIGIVVLVFSLFLLPNMPNAVAHVTSGRFPKLTDFRYLFLAILYVAVLSFYLILYQAFKLLNYIDKGKAFSELSVKALKNIKYFAASISVLYMAGAMPIVYLMAEVDDAPGLILFGFTIGLIPLVISTFAAVLQRLLKDVIDIKSENDLTV